MSRHGRGSSNRLRVLACAGAFLLPLALSGTALGAATVPWQVTRTPVSLDAGVSTEVSVSATLQSFLALNKIGCVAVAVDGAFSIQSARVVATPAGKSWKFVAPVSAGIVNFEAVAGSDRLGNLLTYETVTVGITVTGSTSGTYDWSVTAYSNTTCSSKLDAKTITVSIVGSVSTPAPTATPVPTPAPTALPTAPPTPGPSGTPLSTPLPTPVQSGGSSPTLRPGTTPSPSISIAPITSPYDTASPSPTHTPEATTAGGSSPGGGGTNGGSGTEPPVAAPALVFQVGSSEAAEIDAASVTLAAAVLGSLGVFRWAVPGALAATPGLIVLLAILAQTGGGLAWLPIVRRKIGSLRPSGDRPAARAR